MVFLSLSHMPSVAFAGYTIVAKVVLTVKSSASVNWKSVQLLTLAHPPDIFSSVGWYIVQGSRAGDFFGGRKELLCGVVKLIAHFSFLLVFLFQLLFTVHTLKSKNTKRKPKWASIFVLAGEKIWGKGVWVRAGARCWHPKGHRPRSWAIATMAGSDARCPGTGGVLKAYDPHSYNR